MKLATKRVTAVASIAVIATASVAFITPLAYSDSTTTTIDLEPNNTNVSATLEVDGLDVNGTATGLDPNKRYISLYYGDQSTDNPGRLLTCADVRTAALTSSWRVTPEWDVAEDGTGTLDGRAARPLADGVYTASIREVSPLATDDPYLGFNPVTYPVVACGEVPDAIQDAEREATEPLTSLSGELLGDVPALPVSPNKLLLNPTGLGVN